METPIFSLDFLCTTTPPSPCSSIEFLVETRYENVYRRINGDHITIQDCSIMEPFFFKVSMQTHIASLSTLRDYYISSELRAHNIPFSICDSLARKIGSEIASLAHRGFHFQVRLKIVYQDFVNEAMEMETEEGVLIIDGPGSKGVPGFVIEHLKQQNFYLEGDELSDNTCVICLEEFCGGVSLIRMPACSHVFHQDCIFAWLKNSKTCPTCRYQISL